MGLLSSKIVGQNEFVELMNDDTLTLTAISAVKDNSKTWALALYPKRIGEETRNTYLGNPKVSDLDNEYFDLIEAKSVESLITLSRISIETNDLHIIDEVKDN